MFYNLALPSKITLLLIQLIYIWLFLRDYQRPYIILYEYLCKLCWNDSLFWWQLGVINLKCELIDPDGLLKQLRVLKSINVDGVMVDCWWGIVEAHTPQDYNWNGYKKLFRMVSELKLKLQVNFLRYACMVVIAFSLLEEMFRR